MSEKPGESLIKFRDENCPDLSYSDPKIVFVLLEKLAKKLKKVRKNEK